MTRKSRLSYRTLLRPKYCASATLAAASTTKRDTDAAVNRAMGTPEVCQNGGATLARSSAAGEPRTIRLKVENHARVIGIASSNNVRRPISTKTHGLIDYAW